MAGPRTPNKPVDPLAEKRSKVESFELDARLLEARLRAMKAKVEIEAFRSAQLVKSDDATPSAGDSVA